VAGPRGRFELSFGNLDALWRGARVTVGATIQHDDPRGTQAFGLLRLRFPFGGAGEQTGRLRPIEQRMTDPIVRDVDVVTAGTSEIARSGDNNALLVNVKQVNTSDGQAKVQAALGIGSALVILNGDSPFLGLMDNGLAMKPLQTLIGGGGIMPVYGSVTGRQTSFAAPGSRPVIAELQTMQQAAGVNQGAGLASLPTLTGATLDHLVRAADQTSLRSIDFVGGLAGVRVPSGSTNVVIADNSFANYDLVAVGAQTIVDADINGGVVIEGGQGATTAVIMGNRFLGSDNAAFADISVAASGPGATQVTVTGNTFIPAMGKAGSDDGIFAQNDGGALDLTVGNNIIGPAEGFGQNSGIEVMAAGPANIKITGNVFQNQLVTGALVRSSSGDLTAMIAGNQFRNQFGTGAVLAQSGGGAMTATLANNTFADAGFAAITATNEGAASGPNGSLEADIIGNTIAGTGNTLIAISLTSNPGGGPVTGTIAQNTISGIAEGVILASAGTAGQPVVVQNNTILMPGDGSGIAGVSAAASFATVRNNTIAGPFGGTDNGSTALFVDSATLAGGGNDLTGVTGPAGQGSLLCSSATDFGPNAGAISFTGPGNAAGACPAGP